ncbi:hypothetical protein HS1genome_1579 [Sulfodiicoccus acidiphilus]|uniref:NADH:ubiquinone oxidoreductase-like 20kDa subunit domain-containing protein n=1 Tax=Sulfodiicoccus acidiphilus TaxID=1670455 RepID=A0A348B4T8_9CREN|nr:NADH:ubiquinone oxidoreductase [Sulfodiicoccus acidiphilus]BBD73190.1 hypothetical protein HS1genome_1579 [Sulfodiicoccus acidiphilus]GGU01397.1 hypothetical protein GCM10007116_18240 [Sulfodiicoccus acidiphilus]
MSWFLRGVRRGVRTEKEPENNATWPSQLEVKGEFSGCPTRAIREGKWEPGKCVFCRRCEPNLVPTGNTVQPEVKTTNSLFRKSLHVFPVDVGSCGGCNVELKLLFSPQYDATRFGIFLVNTPRHADALLLMGVMVEGMEGPLREALDAMPEPKVVVLIGACAASGGVLGRPPEVNAHVVVPGCPPTPASIIQALRRLKGDV